jgi:Fic family protein
MTDFPRGTYRARTTQLVAPLGALDDVALELLDRITAARTIVEQAELLPAHEGEMRRSALIGTVHFSTQIEGNPLPAAFAEQAVAHTLDGKTLDELELLNYVSALELIDRSHAEGTLDYSPAFILRLHRVLTAGLGSDEPRRDGHHFRPEHEGAWRDGVVRITDRAGAVQFLGPHPDDVPGLMEAYGRQLEGGRSKRPPVLAGIAHWAMTDIHPFADGNGRMARLMTVAVLVREGFLRRRLFSFERYYAHDRDSYFAALRSAGGTGHRPLNDWMNYFLNGLVTEYEDVARKVLELEQVARQLPATVALRPIESRVLLALVERGQYHFTRAEFETIGKCTRTTAIQSIAHLVDLGAIRKVGSGPSSSYVFARRARAPRARRRWPDERIREELRAFTQGRSDFPSSQEFRDGGKGALYEAIVRHGGSDRWADELGLQKVERRGRPRRNPAGTATS